MGNKAGKSKQKVGMGQGGSGLSFFEKRKLRHEKAVVEEKSRKQAIANLKRKITIENKKKAKAAAEAAAEAAEKVVKGEKDGVGDVIKTGG